MPRKLFTASIILLVLLTAISISTAGSGINMQEGKWEIASKVEMQGMPMTMPPVTYTQCLTKADLVPQSSQTLQGCNISEVKVVDNTVTWSIQCSSESGDMKGIGKITYSGNSLEGTIKVTMGKPGMEMTSHINGHRIGECN